jgi:GNAT superfamily N-acetyltransferase
MLQPEARLARADDLAEVISLYRELRPNDPELPEAKLPALWRNVTNGQYSSVTVVSVDGEIAATAMLALIANLGSGGRRIGLIEHVVTAGRFRRRGLAKQLLQYTLEHAWAANCCKVILLSGAQRVEAHQVYEAVGFSGDVERGFVIKPPTDLSSRPNRPTSSAVEL